MKITFDSMPRWAIVAMMSRAARHVQGVFAEHPGRIAINNAIRLSEDSARIQVAEATALSVADAARNVALRPSNFYLNAQCAANAATATTLEGPDLRILATETLQTAVDIFPAAEQDLKAIADFGITEMLNFVHQQAIHEAGHAVAAAILGIPVNWARIIYEPSAEPLKSPFVGKNCDTVRKELPDDVLRAYRLFYAAGAAADKEFCSVRPWAASCDKTCHGSLGGTDFDADVAEIRRQDKFNCKTIGAVAQALEDSVKTGTADFGLVHGTQIFEALKAHGIDEHFAVDFDDSDEQE